jgi:anti-sigma factor (TIGR02949 family)
VSAEQIDCQECQEQVHEYLQNEVTEDLAAAITAHVANCDHCESIYDTEDALNQVIKDSCQTGTPEQVIQRIRQHISELS